MVSKRHPWITKQKKMPEHKNNNLYGECHSNRAAEPINGMAAWSAVENHMSEKKSNKTVVQTYPLTTQTNRTPYCSILRCRKITPGNEVIAKTLELKARGTPKVSRPRSTKKSERDNDMRAAGCETQEGLETKTETIAGCKTHEGLETKTETIACCKIHEGLKNKAETIAGCKTHEGNGGNCNF